LLSSCTRMVLCSCGICKYTSYKSLSYACYRAMLCTARTMPSQDVCLSVCLSIAVLAKTLWRGGGERRVWGYNKYSVEKLGAGQKVRGPRPPPPGPGLEPPLLSVRPSVTRRYFVETPKHILKPCHHLVATPFYNVSTRKQSQITFSIILFRTEVIV